MPRDKDKENATPRGTRGAARHAGKGGGGARSRDERPARASAKPFGAKPFGSKPPREKAFGDKPYAAKKSLGDKKSFSDKKSFGGKKPFGDRKPFGDKKPFGAKKPFGEKKSFGEKRSFDDKPDRAGGAKRPYAGRGAPDRPRPRADRDAGPPRDRDERPARVARKEFAPRGERGGDDRPRFKPRDDRGGERPFAPRGERSESRPAGRFADKKFGEKRDGGGTRAFGAKPGFKPGFKSEGFRKDGDRPRNGGFRKDGDRPFTRGPRPQGDAGRADKLWQRRDGDERPRFSKPRGDRPDRAASDDRAPRKFSRPRTDGDRPRSDRPRSDRAAGERPTFARPRGDRNTWHDHPRSDAGEERPRGEADDSKIFAKRPAFGGRGAYRERKPDTERRAARPAVPEKTKPGERIAKLLARAGLCSRRDAEEWIMQGRVAVNGRVLTSPALDVTTRDTVTVDGKPLPERERTRLFLYHKPRGLMTTHDDPEGRPTVFDNLPEHLPRLISIGRLDFNTEGLLLLTNDGGLARALELPDTGWLRRYRVRAHGAVTQAQLDALREGVEVEGVKYGSIDAQLERDVGANVWLVFAIREGKNREVRNVLAHLGLEVNRLIRVSYGPFQLAELAEGEVEEVKTRVLREQLGDKIAALANADFQLPVKSDGADDGAEPAAPEKKPRPRAGLISDRKGRRILVQRSGEREEGGERPYRRPTRSYHGKRDIKPRED